MAVDLLPPPWFVSHYNERNPGPWRSPLDPLLMLAWHTVSSMPIVTGKDLILLTGI